MQSAYVWREEMRVEWGVGRGKGRGPDLLYIEKGGSEGLAHGTGVAEALDM